MAEDKNYTNNTERPREDEELEIDLMEYVRKLWACLLYTSPSPRDCS